MVENNGYAEATSSAFHQAGIDVAKRADGFGMPGVVVDGFDFFAVHEVAGEAIARARSGGGPTLIECKVGRYFGHFEGDQQTYRGPNEVENLRRERDCLDALHAPRDQRRADRAVRARRDRRRGRRADRARRWPTPRRRRTRRPPMS